MTQSQSMSNLLDLQPLHLPPAPSWWPIAWGWVSLAITFILVILLMAWLIHKYRKWIAPKKVALRLLRSTHVKLTPSDAIELVRQASLCYFPRQEIAHLTGPSWYSFLDHQFGKPLFVPNESLWQSVLYQTSTTADTQHLIDDCCLWIQTALPPKRKYRR